MNIKYLSTANKKFKRIALSLFASQYSLMLEYRAEIILWAISGILPLIMLGIWQEASISSDIGFTSQWLNRYFISAFVVRQFTAVWVMVSFEEDNLQGRLSPYMLQPLQPFWRYLSSHIAEQITRLPIVVLILSLIFTFMPEAIWFPGLIRIILFIISLLLAFSMRFLLHWLFSMICFWNDRASAIERLLLIPYLFLSGLTAPLEAFPPSVHKFALFTPFPYILSFPANILSGNDVNYAKSFFVILVWLIIFTLLSIMFWKKGVRHYSAMGA